MTKHITIPTHTKLPLYNSVSGLRSYRNWWTSGTRDWSGGNVSVLMQACHKRASIACSSIITTVDFDLPVVVQPPTTRGERGKRREEGVCERPSGRGSERWHDLWHMFLMNRVVSRYFPRVHVRDNFFFGSQRQSRHERPNRACLPRHLLDHFENSATQARHFSWPIRACFVPRLVFYLLVQFDLLEAIWVKTWLGPVCLYILIGC
jgi:hypothetical protein